MLDRITVSGLVATDPRHIVTRDGFAITSFRLASPQKLEGSPTELDTNWYTVTAFRQLAINANESINKGDRIVVHGSLQIREWNDGGGSSGTTVEIAADSLGHDLNHGVSTYKRVFKEEKEGNK